MASVQGELFCTPDHRELYLQAQSTAAYERVIGFERLPPDDSLMRVVERIKARTAVSRPIPPVPEFATLAKLLPRRFNGFWAPSSIAACIAILAFATLMESTQRGAHPFSPLVLAAESRANKAPVVDVPEPPPPPIFPEVLEPAAPQPKPRHVSIRVRETTWLAACSDGKEVLRTVLSTGEMREVDFSREAIVRVGNAGGTDISVDGKAIGPVGPVGALRVIELGLTGFHLIALGPIDSGRDCEAR